ncbi:Eco57I restriction-modification methylase domain-containing protein [Nocardiopsis sp. CC223A]|uniref:Eco57I restriction-modification methylase domain-containing protein n=1 Tax=Nocardiopsis sp. CC223A TaxID=3044051 RepID=UPI00278BDF70|nr:DNA methyltransferase [Nocardiopsis sp. CC223A]
MSRFRKASATDSADQHRNWLSLVEVDGPFLTLPVLLDVWPHNLDPVGKEGMGLLRREHRRWQDDTGRGRDAWVRYVLGGLLDWRESLRTEGLEPLALEVPEHDTNVTPSFALATPEAAETLDGDAAGEVKVGDVRLLGLVCEPGQVPTARIRGESWAASPVDRLAKLCRHHGVELGLATDGRWWVLVWAPRGGVTTTAVFDAVLWPEAAERDVLHAFYSLLERRRFFAVPDEERLVRLLARSLDSQEEVTEALGVQVRQAVELLVAAIGRADTEARRRGEPGLVDVPAHDVYRGAVSVMMRMVFLLFAEERGLLPSDNDLYASTYSAGRLYDELADRARGDSEDSLENGYEGWYRLNALFNAVYHGVDHPRLRMHAHDGSLFDPKEFPWLPLDIDDRTVLHMLRSVQYVQVGRGRRREPRKLSFRALDVEQIGYVYEGLLSFDGYRAEELVVGLVGKEGAEEEVPLRELEELATRHPDVEGLAEALATAYKASGIGSKGKLVKALAPLSAEETVEAHTKLRSVVRGDERLVEQLLPFYRIIRWDLRDLPMLVRPGELYVTESPLRKNTGTHYTPRFLAEEVVEGALEPLVYEPGPLQTADTGEWKLKSSEEILSLKVADIAMGSAAFLVAAARYLGDRLIEAWTAEGDPRVVGADGSTVRGTDELREDDDPVVVEARRQVIEHCLYGVDINPMAVEMAKLSLWLVSMDPKRPFTFLDDRLAAGDSLLGITTLEQIEYMHMDPKAGRKLHGGENTLFDFTSGIRELVTRAARSRHELTNIDGATLEGLNQKRITLRKTEREVEKLKILADLTTGAAIKNSARASQGLDQGSSQAVELASNPAKNESEMSLKANQWLNSGRPDDTFERRPLHWPLEFPEVFNSGGFDAIIGNPPFLGGTWISGSLGSDFRDYISTVTASGTQSGGRADLVSYFILNAHRIANKNGQVGVIATNTLAQGDSREVCLDQILNSGTLIRKAKKSEKWPTKASVEYCAVWLTKASMSPHSESLLDGERAPGITSSLTPQGRITGEAKKLSANIGKASKGMDFGGAGFLLSPEEAKFMLTQSAKNSQVILPLLNGRDLNSSPRQSGSRFIINFRDWTEARAATYPEPFLRVLETVKPERATKSEQVKKAPWWWFWNRRPKLMKFLETVDHVIVIARVSKTAAPTRVTSSQVFTTDINVFTTSDFAFLASLSSAPHFWWMQVHGSSLKTDPRYTISDVFETFAMPELTQELRILGEHLDDHRKKLMLSRNIGLTKTYNLVFDPKCTDSDIEELRTIHRAIDEATVRAYGWEDRIEAVGGLDHGFHPVGRETRYTIGPAAQREVLDSLLELNHQRYAEEVAQGLHDKKGKRKSAAPEGETLF